MHALIRVRARVRVRVRAKVRVRVRAASRIGALTLSTAQTLTLTPSLLSRCPNPNPNPIPPQSLLFFLPGWVVSVKAPTFGTHATMSDVQSAEWDPDLRGIVDGSDSDKVGSRPLTPQP